MDPHNHLGPSSTPDRDDLASIHSFATTASSSSSFSTSSSMISDLGSSFGFPRFYSSSSSTAAANPTSGVPSTGAGSRGGIGSGLFLPHHASTTDLGGQDSTSGGSGSGAHSPTGYIPVANGSRSAVSTAPTSPRQSISSQTRLMSRDWAPSPLEQLDEGSTPSSKAKGKAKARTEADEQQHPEAVWSLATWSPSTRGSSTNKKQKTISASSGSSSHGLSSPSSSTLGTTGTGSSGKTVEPAHASCSSARVKKKQADDAAPSSSSTTEWWESVLGPSHLAERLKMSGRAGAAMSASASTSALSHASSGSRGMASRTATAKVYSLAPEEYLDTSGIFAYVRGERSSSRPPLSPADTDPSGAERSTSTPRRVAAAAMSLPPSPHASSCTGSSELCRMRSSSARRVRSRSTVRAAHLLSDSMHTASAAMYEALDSAAVPYSPATSGSQTGLGITAFSLGPALDDGAGAGTVGDRGWQTGEFLPPTRNDICKSAMAAAKHLSAKSVQAQQLAHAATAAGKKEKGGGKKELKKGAGETMDEGTVEGRERDQGQEAALAIAAAKDTDDSAPTAAVDQQRHRTKGPPVQRASSATANVPPSRSIILAVEPLSLPAPAETADATAIAAAHFKRSFRTRSVAAAGEPSSGCKREREWHSLDIAYTGRFDRHTSGRRVRIVSDDGSFFHWPSPVPGSAPRTSVGSPCASTLAFPAGSPASPARFNTPDTSSGDEDREREQLLSALAHFGPVAIGGDDDGDHDGMQPSSAATSWWSTKTTTARTTMQTSVRTKARADSMYSVSSAADARHPSQQHNFRSQAHCNGVAFGSNSQIPACTAATTMASAFTQSQRPRTVSLSAKEGDGGGGSGSGRGTGAMYGTFPRSTRVSPPVSASGSPNDFTNAFERQQAELRKARKHRRAGQHPPVSMSAPGSRRQSFYGGAPSLADAFGLGGGEYDFAQPRSRSSMSSTIGIGADLAVLRRLDVAHHQLMNTGQLAKTLTRQISTPLKPLLHFWLAASISSVALVSLVAFVMLSYVLTVWDDLSARSRSVGQAAGQARRNIQASVHWGRTMLSFTPSPLSSSFPRNVEPARGGYDDHHDYYDDGDTAGANSDTRRSSERADSSTNARRRRFSLWSMFTSSKSKSSSEDPTLRNGRARRNAEHEAHRQ
ncbi:hypothetical protein K437DRAFT_170924, partial [Tilletiaria anomala UBC 951]